MDSSSEQTLHGVCLVVAYDGTAFAGYQVQPNQRTVQRELERAAARMAGHHVRVRGAGRTDAGVHALGQVVAFDSARDIPARGWLLGLNQVLGDDLRVQRVAPCAAGYHPRFEALEKTYRYQLALGQVQNPLVRHDTYQLAKVNALDVGRMREAAVMMVGTHDFRAFRAADDQRPNTVRTIYSVDIRETPEGGIPKVTIEVRGTAFMKNMVRIMAGTLIDVGRGRMDLARIPALLGAESDRTLAGHTAPARGLTLLEVKLGRRTPSPWA